MGWNFSVLKIITWEPCSGVSGASYTVNVMYEVHVRVNNIIHGMTRANLESNADLFVIVKICYTSCVAI